MVAYYHGFVVNLQGLVLSHIYSAGAGYIIRSKNMSESMAKTIQRRASVDKVITALHDFFEEKDSTSSSVVFASTRDVADRSELSIYNARHILIKLEREGVITSTRKENSKSLYWNKTDSFKV